MRSYPYLDVLQGFKDGYAAETQKEARRAADEAAAAVQEAAQAQRAAADIVSRAGAGEQAGDVQQNSTVTEQYALQAASRAGTSTEQHREDEQTSSAQEQPGRADLHLQDPQQQAPEPNTSAVDAVEPPGSGQRHSGAEEREVPIDSEAEGLPGSGQRQQGAQKR